MRAEQMDAFYAYPLAARQEHPTPAAQPQALTPQQPPSQKSDESAHAPQPAEPEAAQRITCCVCLLCGLPGAGKTTLVRQLMESAPADVVAWHVHYDDEIPDPQRANYESSDASWKQARGKLEVRVEDLIKSPEPASDSFARSQQPSGTGQVASLC